MNNEAMFKVGYGLYVLTAKEGDKHNGCIINTCMQVTDSPKKIAITVNKENLTHDMIINTKKFNISVISEKANFELFKHFGFQSGREVDKFVDFVDKKEANNGVMFITEQTNAYISGEVVETVDLGTHTMFIAFVTDAEVLNDDISATYDYYFKNIKPNSDNKKEESKGYRCVICGYVYEGEELPEDFICPWCKHGVDDFEKIV